MSSNVLFETEGGWSVVTTDDVDFRAIKEVFDITHDHRDLLSPGLILECRLRLHWYENLKSRSKLINLHGSYSGQEVVTPTPTSKFNPHKTQPVALPVFEVALMDGDFERRSIGYVAIAYLKTNESPMMHGYNRKVINEAMGLEPHPTFDPYLGLVTSEGVAYYYRG